MSTICVFCASSTAIDARYVELAGAVGAELARRGHALVTGGGSVSSMGAVAREARRGGVRTVGVIPQALVAHEVADLDADELVVTADMRARKAEMDRRADAFLTLAGGLGTLEELFEIWVARSLGMHDKPIVVLDTDGVYAPLVAQLDLLERRGFVRASARAVVAVARSAPEALDLIEAGLAARVPPAPAPVPSDEELLEAEP